MKQNAQQVRTKFLTLIMAGVAGVGFAAAATAAGVGVGVNANVGAGAQAGGAADAHMSTSGSANSNAQWQSSATRGADRAAERTSTQGSEMNQSGSAGVDATGTATAKGKR